MQLKAVRHKQKRYVMVLNYELKGKSVSPLLTTYVTDHSSLTI